MQIVDFSQIFLAPMYADDNLKSCAANPSEESAKALMHSAINSLRVLAVKHGPQYGKIVIACDNGSWRYKKFPHYKASRKKNRSEDTSGIDWQFVGKTSRDTVAALKEHFPYPVISVPDAEGDDIIGTLVKDSSEVMVENGLFDEPEPVLIISTDKDNLQLQKYRHVRQWSQTLQKQIRPEGGARAALLDKIIGGDAGDGIPGILCADDHFVNKPDKRVVLTAKKRAEVMELIASGKIYESSYGTNYIRNETLVSYEFTPVELQEQIRAEYALQLAKPHSKLALMSWFAERRMRAHYEKIQDFYL